MHIDWNDDVVIRIFFIYCRYSTTNHVIHHSYSNVALKMMFEEDFMSFLFNFYDFFFSIFMVFLNFYNFSINFHVLCIACCSICYGCVQILMISMLATVTKKTLHFLFTHSHSAAKHFCLCRVSYWYCRKWTKVCLNLRKMPYQWSWTQTVKWLINYN